MKKITIMLLVLVLGISSAFAQIEKMTHFEIDTMVGAHQYSSSFFHAINSITWYNNPDASIPNFSGFGTSLMPSFNVKYFLSKNIGIFISYSPIIAENSLYVENIGNYYNKIEQNNISVGVIGKIISTETPLSMNFGTGFIVAPFEINKHFDSDLGGFYLDGTSTGAGFYGMASFQIKILSFLQFKSEVNYSFIPTNINLTDSDQDVVENIENLNIGGFIIKTGLSFNF